jgi:deazaflavin-dependent oxidoreductase (nitroreductase family)
MNRGNTAVTNATNELDWSDLLTLAAEVSADDGPGSKTWKSDGAKTTEINARVMHVLRENGGKIPGPLSAIPCLILTTVGAKTGTARSVPLFCLTIDGRLTIIGSMGGAHRNPPWLYNLKKTPEVLVEKDGETFRAIAVVTEGEERAHFFRTFCETYPIFGEYQAGTSRIIPIIELKRVSQEGIRTNA